MGFKRWVAGFLGFGNHETNHNHNHTHNHNHNDDQNNNSNNDDHHQEEEEEEEEINNDNYIKSNRKGFSVPVQVPVQQIGPLLIPCPAGDGGLQGLGWYTKRLKVDEDGDVADEFLDEVFSETTSNTEAHHKHFHKFEVKLNTKSAKARNPVLSREGRIQQVVEYRGRLLLV